MDTMEKHFLRETYERLFKEAPGGGPAGSADVEKLRDLKALRNQLNVFDPYDFMEGLESMLGAMDDASVKQVAQMHNIRRYTDVEDLSRQLAEEIFEQDTWYQQEN